MTHPKLVDVSDKAFRLWVWGLSYCQTHLTDGTIPIAAIPLRLKSAMPTLSEKGLWHANGRHFHVHDYLDWNDSKEYVLKRRSEAKDRRAHIRTNSPPARSHERASRVMLRTLVSEGVSGKPSDVSAEDTIEMRGGRLVEHYGELYIKHRLGAKHHVRPNLDWHDAMSLCRLWDDARLEKLAVLVLTTDDEWITKTDRSFKIFALKATWADDKLKAWEAKQRITG